MSEFINVAFTAPPSAQSGTFVEVENDLGASIKAGEWVARPDGLWALRIPDPAKAYEKGKADERARCLRWVQFAREEGETDMRDVRDWIQAGKDPSDHKEDDL